MTYLAISVGAVLGANARFLLAIRARLTPEQWKQVQAFRTNHRGMMRRDWRQGGPGQNRMRPDGATPPQEQPPAPPSSPAQGSGVEQ